jgi:hypothetical protein
VKQASRRHGGVKIVQRKLDPRQRIERGAATIARLLWQHECKRVAQ